MEVLNCGLKFVPAPTRPTPAPVWGAAVARFQRMVRLRCQFGHSRAGFDPRYHVPNPFYQPAPAAPIVEAFLQDLHVAVAAFYAPAASAFYNAQHNLTEPQRRALRELSADASIVVKPADKNLGLVILDKAWYVAECQRQLADTATYRMVPAAEAAGVQSQLRQELLQCVSVRGHALPGQVHTFLTTTAATHTTFPEFYLLPKIHKLPSVTPAFLSQLKGRPIVASHSWVTTPASTWLADVLNAACTEAFPHVLPDSRALVVQVESTPVARDSFLVTFDVESMYPSVDVPLAVDACVQATRPGLRALVHALLLFVMNGNFFHFKGDIYQQVKGGAMGTPCMPPVANIHMAHWVEAPVRAAAAYWPRIYARFIDDGFFVWERDRLSLDAFLSALNAALPGINLTWQVSTTSIPYMDLVITKDLSVPGASVPLVVSTYQKPHNKYLYIPRASFHRPHIFAGFVRGELIRYAVTNTHPQGFARMRQLFMQRLLHRGYSKAWLLHLFAGVTHDSRRGHLSAPRRRQRGVEQPQPPVFVASNGPLEMRESLSTVINTVYRKHAMQHMEVRDAMGGAERIVVAYRTNPSIGACLVHAKL